MRQNLICCLVLTAIACGFTGCVLRYESNAGSTSAEVPRAGQTRAPSLRLEVRQMEPIVAGEWTGDVAEESASDLLWTSISVREEQGRANFEISRPARNFPFLVANRAEPWPGESTFDGDAGALEFRGTAKAGKASGQFSFTPNADYARQAAGFLRPPVSNADLLRLRLYDVGSEELSAFCKCGVVMDAAELCGLKAFGISASYVVNVRKGGNFSLEEIKRLRAFGVPEDYPVQLKEAGYKLRGEDITHLRSYGVSAGEAIAWKKTGYGFDAKSIAKLHSYGVAPAFGAAVHGIFARASLEELIKLKSYGVSEQYLLEMRKAGQDFTIDEIIQLRSHGVPADYVTEWRSAGYDVDASALMKLRSHGVPAAFAQPLKGFGYGVGELIRLRSCGVSPDYVLDWRKAGYDFGVPDLVRLRVAGVPSTYAAALNVPGRKLLSADNILRLRQRGMSVEEIRELRE